MANGDHDFVAGETLTAANVDDYLMLQAFQKFATSAARDAALTVRKREGSISIQDDANTITVYSGAAWSSIGPVHGALTAWTPTVTQSVNVTVTNSYSRYMRIGRMVQHWFALTVTGAGTAGNAVILGGLPFTLATASVMVGQAMIIDLSVPNTMQANLYAPSTTTIDFRSDTSAAGDPRLGIATFVAGLAVGDVLTGSFCAEAAADA